MARRAGRKDAGARTARTTKKFSAKTSFAHSDAMARLFDGVPIVPSMEQKDAFARAPRPGDFVIVQKPRFRWRQPGFCGGVCKKDAGARAPQTTKKFSADAAVRQFGEMTNEQRWVVPARSMDGMHRSIAHDKTGLHIHTRKPHLRARRRPQKRFGLKSQHKIAIKNLIFHFFVPPILCAPTWAIFNLDKRRV